MTMEMEDQRTPKEIAEKILKLFIDNDLKNPGMVFNSSCSTLGELGDLCEEKLGDRDIILKTNALSRALEDLLAEKKNRFTQAPYAFSKTKITENALPVLAALRYDEKRNIRQWRSENQEPESSDTYFIQKILRNGMRKSKKNQEREESELDDFTRSSNAENINISKEILTTYDEIEKEFRILADKLGIKLIEPEGPGGLGGQGGRRGGRG